MAERILSKTDMEDIAKGATLLGCGGGGPEKIGISLLEKFKGDVVLLDPQDLPPNHYAALAAGMGSPLILQEKGFGREVIHAFDAIKTMTALGGLNLSYVLASEMGGFNTILAFYVAAERGIPVLDADCAGRAVPELATLLNAVYKLPFGPVVVANDKGDLITGSFTDSTDYAKAELVARTAVVSFGGVAGLSTLVTSVRDVNRYLALNTVSQAQILGCRIREAVREGNDPVAAAAEATGGREFFRGVIGKIDLLTEGGFDFGRTTIEGLGLYEGRTCVLDVKNENILAVIDGKPAIIVPDLITLMTLDGTPLTNVDVKKGQEVGLLGIPASASWKKTPEGFTCWEHILKKMGYQGGYFNAFE